MEDYLSVSLCIIGFVLFIIPEDGSLFPRSWIASHVFLEEEGLLV